VIEDRAVDNVAKSEGEGLRAHNYWDNEQDVIAPLAAWLMDLAGVVAQPAVTGAAVVG
jgi:hypothetical protein